MAKKTFNTGKNVTETIDEENYTVYESIDAWKAEGEKRFGSDIRNWRFKCPMCGHIASVQDFIDAGCKDAENSAYEECLGRYTGKGTPVKGDSSGCNWAAYGLFGIPHGGVYVVTDKANDKAAHIFDFADV